MSRKLTSSQTNSEASGKKRRQTWPKRAASFRCNIGIRTSKSSGIAQNRCMESSGKIRGPKRFEALWRR